MSEKPCLAVLAPLAISVRPLARSFEIDDDKPKEDVQSFIFERELAEVYLLLDFLSGRSDKNLSTAFNSADMPPVMSVGQSSLMPCCLQTSTMP